ncbi:MAG: 50S ribosomal protein L3 [Flavobacteriales bacterium]
MAGLIGRKIGMTSVFSEDGKNLPCTLLEAGPCVVTQVRTEEKDGYSAIQLSYGERKENRTARGLYGHYKKAGTTPKMKSVEFRGINDEFKTGDEIKLMSIFKEGEFVDVIGRSKGKGFQGVVKRHGFSGVGDSTHGQHNRLRAPGSIGASAYPSRVLKGMKMAGRQGGQQVKVLNLKVLEIRPSENILVVKGAVPGPKGAYVIIRK